MHAIDAQEEATAAAVAEGLVRLFHALMRGTGGRVVEALNAHGLSLTEMKALHVLDEDDPAAAERSVKDLGGCLAMSLPAASRTADALLQRGLVARREDPHDRRIKRLTITPRGRELMRELEAVRLQGVAQWVDGLTGAQRDALHTALQVLDADPTPTEASRTDA